MVALSLVVDLAGDNLTIGKVVDLMIDTIVDLTIGTVVDIMIDTVAGILTDVQGFVLGIGSDRILVLFSTIYFC